MSIRYYEYLIILICLFLGFEYLAMNNVINLPHLLQGYNPKAGYNLSYILGIAGVIVMLATNFYIVRKRLGWWKRIGKTQGWFNFHIFCGVLGPILIIFHTNFTVHGLVSISFWSMIICASSGIIGRYFYLQALEKKNDIAKSLKEHQKKLSQTLSNKNFSDIQIDQVLKKARIFGGIDQDLLHESTQSFIVSLMRSLYCDTKLLFRSPGKTIENLDKTTRKELTQYLILFKKLSYWDACNKFVGYWHAFHLPFAFFMYIVAIIHIISSLLFSVKH